MEIKCNICGAINNEGEAFCKGCYLPLHKTLDEWTKAIETRVNLALQNDESVLKNVWDEKIQVTNVNNIEPVPLEEQTNVENVWGNDEALDSEPAIEDENVSENIDETENEVKDDIDTIQINEEVIEPVSTEQIENENNLEFNKDEDNVSESNDEEQTFDTANPEEYLTPRNIESVVEDEESKLTLSEVSKKEEKPDDIVESSNNVVEKETQETIDSESEKESVKNEEPILTETQDDLRSVSIEKEEEEPKNEIKVKSALSYIIKFDLILIILSLAFTFIYGININNTMDILLGAASTIIFVIITVFVTFRKPVSTETNQKAICRTIMITMLLFEIVLRIAQLYISKFAYVYIFVFILLIYLLITILTLNIIGKMMKNDETKKYVSKLNIITLILTILLVAGGILAKNNDIKINYDNTPVQNITETPSEVGNYIASVNNYIVTNAQNDENYVIPTKITDLNFIETDPNITAVDLTVDEYGTVKKGTITYKKTTYIYQDGIFMTQK